MAADQRDIINSRLGVGIGLLIGRFTPEKIGYKLAYRLADYIAGRQDWPLVKAVRTNQWVVSQQRLSGSKLDEVVRETFRNTARAIYDLFHYFNDPEAIKRMIKFDEPIQSLIQRSQTREAGMVVVGVHLSSFDLALRAISLLGLNALLLSMNEHTAAHERQYKMRRGVGLEIVPANMSTLRQAIAWLKGGGVVLTGVDRPLETAKYRPEFFGHPSVLPVHHIHLALKANVPVVMAAMVRDSTNTYRFLVSEPIPMRSYPDRRIEITKNAETVLEVAEEFIRQAPHQWSISFPVWPEMMDQLPQGD